MTNSNKASLFSQHFNFTAHLPASIYWKDTAGYYCGRNAYACQQMQAAGFEYDTLPEDIIGQTDYDIYPSATAKQIRHNDLMTMHKACTKTWKEKFYLPRGGIVYYLSSKQAWLDSEQNIIGIIGTSIAYHEPDFLNQTKLIFQQKPHDLSLLTERQSHCLFYLVQGYSIKCIAKVLALSPRTVEHYLETIKIKLSCDSRKALIQKGLDLFFQLK